MAEIKYLDQTGLGTVKSILDGLFAPKSHNHNNLYYTKTESDNLLAGKSNTGHTHDYLSKTQYGYSIDTYRFDVGQNDRGWVHLGYFYGSNSGIKIDCDYTSHCASSYGICDASITFGVRNATFEGYISKNTGTSSGLYITESKDSGYKYYHVYIYLRAWLQGHVRIQDLGSSSTFVWNISNEEPDSTCNIILDCRNLNGFYVLHNGQISKVIDEGNISSQSVSYATTAGSAVDQTARDSAAVAQTTANGKWTYDSSKFLRRDDTQGYLSKFVLEDIPKNVTQVGSIGWTDYQNYPHAGGLWMTLKGNSSLRTALILFPTYNMSHPPILYSSIDNGSWQGGHTLAYRSDIPTNNNQLTNGAGYITSAGSITGSSGSCTGNAATATTAGKASYLTKAVDSVTATTRSSSHGSSMALFTSGWASNSAGFHTTYGTTLDLSGYSTWYHRLAFGTDGQIEHWMGINTNTLTNQGRLCYTHHSHTTFNSLTINGSVTASSGFFDNSDERLKDIIDNVNVDVDKLSELRKVYFNFKNDHDKKHIGVIAQDVQKIYPEIVEENGEGMLTVDYSKLSVIALDAVDQLNQKNKELEDRLNKIENLLKDKGIL